jgi:hypothetical protein
VVVSPKPNLYTSKIHLHGASLSDGAQASSPQEPDSESKGYHDKGELWYREYTTNVSTTQV